ncbi:helicase HerA domain-containing protein [Marinobacter sp. F4216]|uniref:helicase HerA domain-containing protein n=1 Tax=Marinobacter sp. F4216 TaxID=2874281 RepID=UPI001CC0DE81|nr:DUF87 domain-containing protein [Marinobacter sp. F4216]MBZ2170268.1 ATP-binding protein [Marinobacter sp. F4216]
MSLKSQPLLVFNGVESAPMHGCYASSGSADGSPSAIHEGLDKSVVITFDDANRHLITLGATGSRKTTSVQAPAIVRLIETGCSGVVIDVKGEYRHLYDEYPDRVVVIGADDDATPYNLIQGMSDDQFATFLNEHRTNLKEPYWGMMGVQDARFVRKTYELMGQEATLADIVDALKEPRAFVQRCDAFVRFKKTLPKDYLSLLSAVKANRFSILAMGESELLELEAPSMEEVQKQYSWQTNGIVGALAPFSVDPCLRAKFCPAFEPGEETEDTGLSSMRDLLYRDRKVLLMDVPLDRFGSTAHVISKLLRIRMISAITGFRRHKQIGCGEHFYTFFAADEYQHLVNVDERASTGGLYDDTTFFDRCRGYGHINLIATQSVSALRAKVPAHSAERGIDCLLQNIGTVVVFSSSDPATDQVLTGRVSALDAEQISSVVRSDLPAGHAYVLGRSLRRHVDATLVARIQATAIPGAPYMSRYFAGMPEPFRVPAFSQQPELLTNPFHKKGAELKSAGINELRMSFEQRQEEVVESLAQAQAQECPPDVLMTPFVRLMEDEELEIALYGDLQGEMPTLWQRYLSLVITQRGSDGWECWLPMAEVMPHVEQLMTKADRATCDRHRQAIGFDLSEVAKAVSDRASLIRVEPPERGGVSSDKVLRIHTESVSLTFSWGYWSYVCRCLGHLEAMYGQVSLQEYDGDSDYFPDDELLESVLAEA